MKNNKNKLNNISDSALINEWYNLKNKLWDCTNSTTITPNKFINTLQKVALIKNQEIFSGYQQNDVSEFLIFLIDCFHNALARKVNMEIKGSIINAKDKIAKKCYKRIKEMYENDYSEIWNLFYGIHISKISSITSNQILNINPEPFFIINLPIPSQNKSPSLIDCFNLYVEGEVLDGENAIKDEKSGNKIACNKSIEFWSLPTILVIDIKRFNYQNKKNQILVTFPINDLNLTNYVLGYNKTKYIYDLYAVCNHSGGVLGGHYTSYIKTSNGEWYLFNDTIISKVNKEEEIITSKAYCFFYRKKTIQ